jgi:outer membrane protein assembly factor BamB
MAQTNLIFIGVKGTVVALDRATGSEVWRSELKGKDFVNVVLQDGDLYATTKGELFRLDPATGKIRWQNPLKGLGWGLITIAASGSQQAVVMREKGQRDEAAAAAASGTATMG